MKHYLTREYLDLDLDQLKTLVLDTDCSESLNTPWTLSIFFSLLSLEYISLLELDQ